MKHHRKLLWVTVIDQQQQQQQQNGRLHVLIQNILGKMIHISDKFIRNFKGRIYSLPMNLHKHQLYLLEQHSESFKVW